MTYKGQHPKLPTKTHFSTFNEKDYPYISFIYTIKCKEPIHFKPIIREDHTLPNHKLS